MLPSEKILRMIHRSLAKACSGRLHYAWIVAGPRYVILASPLSPDATNLPVSAPFVPWLGSVLTERHTCL